MDILFFYTYMQKKAGELQSMYSSWLEYILITVNYFKSKETCAIEFYDNVWRTVHWKFTAILQSHTKAWTVGNMDFLYLDHNGYINATTGDICQKLI